MRTYVITANGKLFVSGRTLAFRDADLEKTYRIPVKAINAVLLTGQATVTGDAMSLAEKNRIIIVHAPGGKPSCVSIPFSYKGTGRLHLGQARMFYERRMDVARAIEEYGVAHATETNTRLKLPEKDVNYVKKAIRSAETPEELMGVEGIFYKAYYAALDSVLPSSLKIGQREYRPPPNRGNATVSYINSLIYGYLLAVLAATGIDTSISYIHEPVHGPIALALDVAEMYRPTLLSRTFLLAVGKYKLSQSDFTKTFNGYYLTRPGRQKVSRAFLEQLSKTVVAEGKRRKLASVINRNAYALRKAFYDLETPKFLGYRVV